MGWRVGWWIPGGLLLALLLGCQPATSPSDASAPPERCFRDEPGSPVIRSFSYLGTLPQQPQTLRFKVEWEDNGADLQGGSYQFAVNGEARALEVLSSAAVGDGVSGSMELLLPLSSRLFVAGARIRVELLLRDKASHRSNVPLLVLEVQTP